MPTKRFNSRGSRRIDTAGINWSLLFTVKWNLSRCSWSARGRWKSSEGGFSIPGLPRLKMSLKEEICWCLTLLTSEGVLPPVSSVFFIAKRCYNPERSRQVRPSATSDTHTHTHTHTHREKRTFKTKPRDQSAPNKMPKADNATQVHRQVVCVHIMWALLTPVVLAGCLQSGLPLS